MAITAVQAHRGSPDPASGIAENTLRAFARARRLGADGVELDARLTEDGTIAVHHDPEIPGLGPIADLRADRLPAHVPSLAAALDACSGMIVNIEVKNLPGEPGFDADDQLARDIACLVGESGLTSSVVVSSFWPQALTRVHEVRPEIATGLLVAPWFDPADIVPLALDRSCTAVHPHATLVTEVLVAEARRAGLSIATWTVNERPQLDRLIELGVDTVITDDVPLVLDALGRRPF